jgi:4-coumarate--CoA ligase
VKFIVVEPELLPAVLDAITITPGLIDRSNIFIFNTRGQISPAGFRSWDWLLQHGEEDWIQFDDLERSKNTEVARLSTSGTTGLPKIAVQSHYNATSWYTMASEIKIPQWEIRNLYPLPMFHVATVPAVHAGPFRSGNVAHIMRRFELEAFLTAIERYQITYLGIVPPLVISIIMSPFAQKYSLKSIKRVGCGAAPLDKYSGERFKALCAPDCTFTQVLGMTETTGLISLFYYPDEDDTGSVGNTFMPNTDVK